MRSVLVLIAMLVAALVPAPGHAAPGRHIMVGAAEDSAKQGDPVAADAKMSLARLAGFNTIRMTSIWWPGESQLSAGELGALQKRRRLPA
jgi:hypothetical protein